MVALAADPGLVGLVADAGLDPVAPDSIARVGTVHGEHRERLLSTDPLRATYAFAVDGATPTLTVDDSLSVIDRERRSTE